MKILIKHQPFNSDKICMYQYKDNAKHALNKFKIIIWINSLYNICIDVWSLNKTVKAGISQELDWCHMESLIST